MSILGRDESTFHRIFSGFSTQWEIEKEAGVSWTYPRLLSRRISLHSFPRCQIVGRTIYGRKISPTEGTKGLGSKDSFLLVVFFNDWM